MNWLIWRPVINGLGTLKEVKYDWTIDDLMDAHEALDVKEEIEARAMEGRK